MSHFFPHRPDLLSAPIPRPRRQLCRPGHTLIEILLALGLSLVILAAAYAALDQHWRYAEAGQQQTERTQVARALFERMSLDLRSVVFRPDTGSARHSAVAGAPPATLGIVGDGQKLVLRVDVPSVERPSGVETIRWEMNAFEANLRDGNYAASSRADGETASGPATLGLVRIARPEVTLEAAKTVSPADLLAAEVKTVRFRYFARGSWSDHWDSVEQQELPRAVEITIGFRDATAAEPTTSDQTNSGEYRLIVPVPASEV